MKGKFLSLDLRMSSLNVYIMQAQCFSDCHLLKQDFNTKFYNIDLNYR